MSVLNVKDLKIGYVDVLGAMNTAVDGVSFSVGRGETVGIVGESGCGKSTIARALMGYLRPGGKFVGGSIELAGQSVLDLSEDNLRKIRGATVAVVPQNPLSSLTFHMTVGDQLREILQVHRKMNATKAKAEAIDLFAATGLPDPDKIFDRYPHQISGGQRQRVVIATALACRPALMILDEPTTALDTTTEMQVLKLVKSLRETMDMGIVYITHDLTLTNYMCDRVLVMHSGKVVEEGTQTQIFEQPKDPYTRRLVAAIPRVDRPSTREKTPDDQIGEKILAVKDLCFSYTPQWSLARALGRAKTQLAVKSVSFDIRQGEILGLVGESGSGKSTIANLVAGLSPPSGGSILFEGKPLHPRGEKRKLEERRRIQLIAQDPLSSLNPRHRIGTILTRSLMDFLGLDKNAARERAVALLEEMELPAAFMERYPRQLSGGQQQRVAVARAFAADPDLIICDEITSALDVSVQAHVLNLLTEIQRKHRTACMFISHDLGVIREMSHRAVVLRHGAVVEAAETETMFRDTKDPYTRHLFTAALRLDETNADTPDAERTALT